MFYLLILIILDGLPILLKPQERFSQKSKACYIASEYVQQIPNFTSFQSHFRFNSARLPLRFRSISEKDFRCDGKDAEN